ncbi:hypothetical protein B0H17DRAFT_147233 [Mycena rosella]|uniref:Uncharacterized protein n=1 Tax=Mycena rosella TaxID=1033263 RepID=A0AAD7DZA9_MYCRO|nr:hypothetical protein B0H17DRAFT_147233 [Mycena rosella]
MSTIVALTEGYNSAKVVRELQDIPGGCGGMVLTPTVTVHALVRASLILLTHFRSLIDIEIAKCEKKLEMSRANLQKITKIETQADYQETVPANFRSANEDERKTLEAEISTWQISRGIFVNLK